MATKIDTVSSRDKLKLRREPYWHRLSKGRYLGLRKMGGNPVTDAEHQMITVLPDGWVFHEAENVAGFAKGTGPIRFDLNRRHSSMAHVAWNPNGLVHSYKEYKQKFGRP